MCLHFLQCAVSQHKTQVSGAKLRIFFGEEEIQGTSSQRASQVCLRPKQLNISTFFAFSEIKKRAEDLFLFLPERPIWNACLRWLLEI
jgi:hypothetical protein